MHFCPPGRLHRITFALLLGAAPPASALAQGAAPASGKDGTAKAAIFETEMNDPTLPYGRKSPPADLKRLELATSELRKSLTERAGLESVDLAPQADEIRKQSPLFKCNGCTGDIAKALGADLAVTAVAEKGSTQLYNLSVTIAEAGSGKVVRRGQVVVRENTDGGWSHAMRWIVKNRLLAEPLPNRS